MFEIKELLLLLLLLLLRHVLILINGVNSKCDLHYTHAI